MTNKCMRRIFYCNIISSEKKYEWRTRWGNVDLMIISAMIDIHKASPDVYTSTQRRKLPSNRDQNYSADYPFSLSHFLFSLSTSFHIGKKTGLNAIWRNVCLCVSILCFLVNYFIMYTRRERTFKDNHVSGWKKRENIDRNSRNVIFKAKRVKIIY